MKAQIVKKISAICLVLVISGATWACGGKGGGCGDKDKKANTTVTAQYEARNVGECGKGEKKDGCCKDKCPGEKKECPNKK